MSSPNRACPVMSYQYDNIDQTEHEIRVLEVLPELSNGTISCRLRHTALNSTYTCLSYTWGSSQKPRQILINERAFFVGTNLHCFLHVARLSRSRVPLWIDAICINQIDPRERNHQVRLMGQIYGCAKQVLAWLGDGSIECEDLLHLIDREDRPTSGCLPCTRARMKINEIRSHGTDRAEYFFQAMNDICCSAYWNRIWTVQEFLLAQNIKLMYKHAEANIETFEIFMEEWTRSEYEYPPPHLKTIESSERVKVYCEERRRFWQSRHARVSLSSLLYSFHDSQCTDQEDRIYAMLSLARRGADFPIDYTVPTIELLFRTICFCKPETLRELARLSSLLVSTLVMKPAEQQFVQDFVVQARSSSKLNVSVLHLPAIAFEVCFLPSGEVSRDLTDDVNTTTLMLGCPQDYDKDPYAQHLFDFVTQGNASSTHSTFYLVLIDWLSMHLELACIPVGSNDEECSVVGIAIQHPSQLAGYVYVLRDAVKLTGISIRYRNLDGECRISLGYSQLLCLLDYMQHQRDAWNEELDMSDVYFGQTQEVVFKPLHVNADDDNSEQNGGEDSESQESDSEVREGRPSH